jgi:ABC-2 type transport system ATP-binding protein
MAIIEVTHLQKRYGATVAVDDVSLAIEAGEVFGILGPNGAGKTTLVECMSGLREPDAGSVSVLGFDPRRKRGEVQRVLGMQLQESALPDKLKVGEALELYASFYEDPADPPELLALLGLTEKRETRFAKLSGGQKQRLSIALALIGKPRVAVLDELTTGLDPQARRDTWTLIEDVRDHGVTIVLVTHFMEEAERLCDRVALIDSGRVVTIDTPAGVAGAAGGQERIRFRPSLSFEHSLLERLPEVQSVETRGDELTVTVTGGNAGAVISALAQHGIVAQQLRIEQGNLEDAFVALVGGAHHE